MLFLLFVAVMPPASLAGTNDVNLISSPETLGLVYNGGYAVKKEGRIIAAHNLYKMFIPASIVKIATSLAALQVLNPRYRFETYFFLDENQNMYIKGLGDPFLISEEIARIVQKLKELGCRRINDIYLDDTAFDIPASVEWAGSSDNPYDAPNNALAVNFNTVNIIRDQDGNVSSAEEQTPTIPLMSEFGEDLESGKYRINICQKQTKNKNMINRFVGELFRAFQRRENIPGSGTIVSKKTPDSLLPFYKHQSSKTLEDSIALLMLYSNNFIANQLYLTMGAVVYGYPATWEKSKKAMAEILLRQFKLSEGEIRIFEGSGLSRENLVSPYAMLELLEAFKPYKDFLPRKDGKLLKSGTLKGVYSYGGYFIENNQVNSFVLILNQEKNTRKRLLQVLEQVHNMN